MEVNQQSRETALFGGTISLVALATIAVALRMYARSITKARYWWDDWVLILALVFDYGLSICYWLQAVYGGLGRHTVAVGGPVTDEEMYAFFKIFLPLQIFYFTSTFAIKTSLILLYYRIFAIVHGFRWTLIAAELIVLANFIVDFFVAIFQCKPVAYFWDKAIAGGSCINQTQFYRWNGVANLLIDFMILALTMPMIWNMSLQFRQKLSLSGLFLLGTFACAASVIRVIAFNQVNFNDITYTMVDISIWSTVESSIGIICACLITYRPLIGRLRSTYSGNITDHGTPGVDASKSVEMPNRRSKVSHGSSDASTAGFARLIEEDKGMAVPTTHVTSIRTMGVPPVPKGAVRSPAVGELEDDEYSPV